MDAHCENQVPLTLRCSSHPSDSQERSLEPSLLSIAKSLVPLAVTRGLLGSSGAASSSGHRVRHRRLWWPSGGCYFMVQWLGYALWLSAWLVLVLGQAWVQSRPLCEAMHGDSSAPPSSSDFNSFETR